MKLLYTLLILFLFISCKKDVNKINIETQEKSTLEIIKPEFKTILDSSLVEGAILIYDSKKDIYYSNDFEWCKKGFLPASTFKITNSIIALETKVVENDSTLFKWNGEKRRLKNWEQDLILKDAFHYSCVPCYQEIARKIGVEKMKKYLNKLDYGKMIVDSTSIDLFWLEGNSKITQFEQIDFLKRFYNSKLPISKTTENIMKKMMVIDESENYKLSGKTGWSIRNGNNNGWFVGYIKTNNNVYYFATNINPLKKFNMDLFPIIRNKVTLNAFRELKIIE
jgi:beta-lactamase class D